MSYSLQLRLKDGTYQDADLSETDAGNLAQQYEDDQRQATFDDLSLTLDDTDGAWIALFSQAALPPTDQYPAKFGFRLLQDGVPFWEGDLDYTSVEHDDESATTQVRVTDALSRLSLHNAETLKRDYSAIVIVEGVKHTKVLAVNSVLAADGSPLVAGDVLQLGHMKPQQGGGVNLFKQELTVVSVDTGANTITFKQPLKAHYVPGDAIIVEDPWYKGVTAQWALEALLDKVPGFDDPAHRVIDYDGVTWSDVIDVLDLGNKDVGAGVQLVADWVNAQVSSACNVIIIRGRERVSDPAPVKALDDLVGEATQLQPVGADRYDYVKITGRDKHWARRGVNLFAGNALSLEFPFSSDRARLQQVADRYYDYWGRYREMYVDTPVADDGMAYTLGKRVSLGGIIYKTVKASQDLEDNGELSLDLMGESGILPDPGAYDQDDIVDEDEDPPEPVDFVCTHNYSDTFNALFPRLEHRRLVASWEQVGTGDGGKAILGWVGYRLLEFRWRYPYDEGLVSRVWRFYITVWADGKDRDNAHYHFSAEPILQPDGWYYARGRVRAGKLWWADVVAVTEALKEGIPSNENSSSSSDDTVPGTDISEWDYTRPGTPAGVKKLKGISTKSKKFYEITLNTDETGTGSEHDNTRLKRALLAEVEPLVAPIGTPALAPVQLTGTVAVVAGAVDVVGTGTLFTQEVDEGDAIMIASATPDETTPTYGVLRVLDDTHLEIDDTWGGATGSFNLYNGWPDTNPAWVQAPSKVIKGIAARRGKVRVVIHKEDDEVIDVRFRVCDRVARRSPWAVEGAETPMQALVLRLSRTFSLANSGIYSYDPSTSAWAPTNPPGVYHIKTDYPAWPVGARFIYGQAGQFLLQLWRRSPDQATCLSVSMDKSGTWALCVLPAGYLINGVGERFVDISEAGNGKTIYVVARDSGGAYHCLRSPDAGATWHIGATDVHFYNASYPVASPADAMTVYVTRVVNLVNCLFKSEDGGDNFTQMASFPDTTQLPCILAMPQSAGSLIVLEVNPPLMWRTGDGGATYSADIRPISATYSLSPRPILARDPSDPETIYTAGRLFDSHSALVGWWFAVSHKGMATVSADWTVYTYTDHTYYPMQIIVDPLNPLNIYISVPGAPFVLISNDGGVTWTEATGFPGGDDGIYDPDQGLCVFGEIGAPPQDRVPIYALGYNGAQHTRSLWDSTDDGDSWARYWQDASITMTGPWAAIAREPDDTTGQTIYRGMEGVGVKVSSNKGEDSDNWLTLGSKWRKILVPPSSSYGYVVDNPGSLFRTATRKNTPPILWQKIAPPGVTAASACYDPSDPKTLHLLGDDGLVYTTLDATAITPAWDAGQPTGFTTSNAQEIICPASGVLWVVGKREVIDGTSTVIRHSVDGAATFTNPTDPNVGITSLDIGQVFVTASGALIVLSSNGTPGLWRSPDAGVTWTNPYMGVKCYGVAPMPDDAGSLVLGCDGVIQLSSDDGVTWVAGGSTGDVNKKFLAVC